MTLRFEKYQTHYFPFVFVPYTLIGEALKNSYFWRQLLIFEDKSLKLGQEVKAPSCCFFLISQSINLIDFAHLLVLYNRTRCGPWKYITIASSQKFDHRSSLSGPFPYRLTSSLWQIPWHYAHTKRSCSPSCPSSPPSPAPPAKPTTPLFFSSLELILAFYRWLLNTPTHTTVQATLKSSLALCLMWLATFVGITFPQKVIWKGTTASWSQTLLATCVAN